MSRIIPAIDLIGGKCVRLEEGDFSRQTDYQYDPLEMAKRFEDHGLKYLHLVDLDGAKEGRVVNWKVLERIASQTHLIVDFGGGIKQTEDIRIAMESGAAQVNVGSIAVKAPEQVEAWLEDPGADHLILSADVKEGQVAINGWQTLTEWTLNELIQHYQPSRLTYVTSTDISKDGKLSGPAFGLYEQLKADFPKMNFTASGGVTTLQDVEKLIDMKMFGIIIGKALYEGHISLSDLTPFAT
ncbi:MAG: 1-(5-phosphoribosyl)-5-[(5-phosphoribosylamino)methylideneamino]imidazole-4-carboxamide isomerase [Bacteroidota bacterium]